MEEKVDMGFMKKKREKVEEREKWKVYEKNIELKKLIRRGSFGIVYKGVYHNGDEFIDVAVKVFDWGEESKETSTMASTRKAFLQEISISSNLEHPNIAKMIGAIYNEARRYGEIQRLENSGLIVMEYIPQGTLKSYLIEHVKTKLTFDEVVKFALGVARGLSYLHSKKIVHRDVKLENVLLDYKLNVKLTNFKVARFEPGPNQDEDLKTENIFHDYELDVETTVSGVSRTEGDSNQNKMTDVAGTIGYMAPEVLKEKPYDHKCDVYSFGICLWEIYCCEEPFPNINCSYQTPGFIYELVRPRIPRCCPKALGMVMVKCWDSDPKRRPEMREVVSMLEAIYVSKGRGMAQDESPSWLSCLMRA